VKKHFLYGKTGAQVRVFGGIPGKRAYFLGMFMYRKLPYPHSARCGKMNRRDCF
jgi:hypothetical protein